ncbi:hypothetical protein Vretimale_1096 [Volvox reticuliferus]|uniref:Uncharacterized protein n=2 Tax=Volvox reticuliferus TaxID=1737510 RepID=A0A8J4D942_9CHLO|nr:hypothetical protein Vretimale_1096 [Volvox reticuliferus]
MALNCLSSVKGVYLKLHHGCSRTKEGQQSLRVLKQLPHQNSIIWRESFANNLACKSPTRPSSRGTRKLVRRRTSEHWWEDEEEFDAITEVVTPKRLHLAAAAASAADESTVWGPLSEATLRKMFASSRGRYSSGFSSTKHKAEAEVLWRQLQQDGPPFFKKVRTRATLDVLEDDAAGPDAVSKAAEELWGELCGQTWRVELDYGLEGSENDPRDELLLICGWLAATRILNHAGLSNEDSAARCDGVFVVHVSGYSASEPSSNADRVGTRAPRTWRDLRPQLQPLSMPAGAAPAASVP